LARKILLADDSVTAQNMGRKILTDAGYDVLTVNNGSAALKRIAESAPDLIILDVYMPGYSGLEVCQRLKEAEETAHIPILLSVGKLEPFKPQEARRVRADAHIVKPFEASQLLTAIARLEDAMVPQPHKGSSRFATSGASDEPYARPEDRILGRGAKSSGSKKKEAADSGLSPQAASFRDFRNKKAKAPDTSSSEWSEPNAVESVPESGPLSKLPRDITPEELSALSEAAAKLSAAAAAQNATPSSELTSIHETSIHEHEEESAVPAADAATMAPASAVPESTVPESAVDEEPIASAASEIPAPASVEPAEVHATDVAVPATDRAEVSAVAEVPASEKYEIEIPVAQVEPATERAGESNREEVPKESEVPLPALVSAASFTEAPAIVDQQDEPMFASARAEEATAPDVRSAVVMEAQAAEVSATVAEASKAEVSTHAEEAETNEEEYPSVDSSFAHHAFAEAARVEAVSLESVSLASSADEYCAVEAPISGPIHAASGETTAAEAPMPSDAELAEALRLLTPAIVRAEPATVPADNVSANARWSDEETMELPAGKRWVAEALQLTPEEAAMSLEAEMFRAFAANAEKIESIPVEDPLTAIQAAVEKRIAEEVAANEPAGEIAPRAMAATAPHGHGSSVADETDIASIVDKVMADLRPRIVEEIARKLAGK
jgi:CheY-like chemotaxis protein